MGFLMCPKQCVASSSLTVGSKPFFSSHLSGLSQLHDLTHEESRGLKFREDSEGGCWRAAFWTPCKVGHQSLW